MRALPEPVAAQAESVRRAASPAPDRGAARPDPETTTLLVQAISDHRRVRLEYCTEAGSQWSVEADPWAVVVRHGRWYLLCRTHPKSAVRAYRVDRVGSVDVLADTFVPPVDLDPVGLLEDHLASGWEFDVELRVDAPLDLVSRCVPRTLGRLEAIDDHATRLVGSTSNPRWYAEQLTVMPAPFVVLGCRELQRALRAVAERMLAAAGPQTGASR